MDRASFGDAVGSAQAQSALEWPQSHVSTIYGVIPDTYIRLNVV